MFRIREIRTLEPPMALLNRKRQISEGGWDAVSDRDRKSLARYENVMKVLKPNQCFEFVSDDIPSDFFHLPDMPYLPAVNISAIVGENGMGKTSLIDLMIRLVNNTAYALKLGLTNGYKYHLRFVGDIYASLVFESDNGIFELRQENNVLTFKDADASIPIWEFDFYKRDRQHSELRIFTDDGYEMPGLWTHWSDNPYSMDTIREMFSGLFYTIVVNYSAYGNNVRDLQPEYTEDDELEIEEDNRKIDPDTRIWLNGILNKNDAYQLPLVLTPYRSSGIINYNSEQNLTNDRLIQLALMYPSPLDDVLEGKRPYSIVLDTVERFRPYSRSYKQGHTNLVSFGVLELIRERYESKNKRRVINDELYFEQCVREFGKMILDAWEKSLGIDFFEEGRKLNRMSCGDGDRALSYLVYKTLKIAFKYRQQFDKDWYDELNKLFNTIYDSNKTDFEEDGEFLEEYIEALLSVDNHILLKLRRTLALLIFKHYTTKEQEVSLKEFNMRIEEIITAQQYKIEQVTEQGSPSHVHLWKEEELLPSPSVKADVRFKLNGEERIPASILSSGERQLIGVVASVIYHIQNISSHCKDESRLRTSRKKSDLMYPYLNIIFDEAELYFHPKYQTQFIKSLLMAINGLKINDAVKGINIIIATHSPFLLSDIPRSNVLCLRDGKPYVPTDGMGRTFCANVYDLLYNDFFMKQFVGDFAIAKVKEMMARIENPERTRESYEELRKEIELIGDDLVRRSLLRKLGGRQGEKR